MIIVMVVIIVLGVLAGGFAYSMKVEMTLARNANRKPDLKWIARSGVEFARYVLAQQAAITEEPYDSLNQIWAGGPGVVTNEFLANISLKNNQLGPGQFSVEITDMERKFNINLANKVILKQAMIIMNADVGASSTVIDSILDWRDQDNQTRISGTESQDYEQRQPPYLAKNGPIDHLSELLRVAGVTPEMYWGPKVHQSKSPRPQTAETGRFDEEKRRTYPVGLVELFTPVSARFININTASSEVLQLVPGVGPNVAQEIVRRRAGPDQEQGTYDDMPYRSSAEIPLPGMSANRRKRLSQIFSVRSLHFKVEVTARIGSLEETYVALVRRSSPNNVHTLYIREK